MSNFLDIRNRKALNVSNNTSSSSMSSSFASDASWDSCSMVNTPSSSHDISFDGNILGHLTYSNIPIYTTSGLGHDYVNMSMDTQRSSNLAFGISNSTVHQSELIPIDCSQMFPAASNNTFISHHGLPSPPIDVGYSSIPSTQNSLGYVTPADTTFGNSFDVQSPIRSRISLSMEMDFNSPVSDYQTDFDDSMTGVFDGSFRSSTSPYSSTCSTPARAPTERPIKIEALPSSEALQRIQGMSRANSTTRRKQKAQRRMKRDSNDGSVDLAQIVPAEFPLSEVKKGTHKCDVPGCSKKFARHEHLKRHQESHSPRMFTCQFCTEGKQKQFQEARMDNYQSHLKLHAKDTPRTNYNPAAAIELAKLQASSRCRARTGRQSRKGTQSSPA